MGAGAGVLVCFRFVCVGESSFLIWAHFLSLRLFPLCLPPSLLLNASLNLLKALPPVVGKVAPAVHPVTNQPIDATKSKAAIPKKAKVTNILI